MTIGFDVISDLNLSPNDKFDWSNKVTSLFCIIPGNISNDITVMYTALKHLSTLYQGVFFIDGGKEHPSVNDCDVRTSQISKICKMLKNVVYLHNHVVIVDGIALVGCNGWYGNYEPSDIIETLSLETHRCDDLSYTIKTIERLQLHVDVQKIVMITNCVPSQDLYFGEVVDLPEPIGPAHCLLQDTESKITTWVYGTHNRTTDTIIDSIRYVNNSCYGQQPYWAKRIEV